MLEGAALRQHSYMLRLAVICFVTILATLPLSAAENSVRDLQRLLGRMQAEQAEQRAALLAQVRAAHPQTHQRNWLSVTCVLALSHVADSARYG